MLIDKLKQLQTEGQPQTLDELFQSSKEGMLLNKVKNAVNALLPAMRDNIAKEVEKTLTDEIRRQIGAIRVRDGVDGNSPDPKEIIKSVLSLIPVHQDGKPGKDAVIDKNEIINEVLKQIPRGKKGGGGSTMRVDNLSSQANGSTRSFTTTYKIGSAHLLFYSSFPTFFLPTTDYSVSGTTITLGSSIDPPVAGQSLAIIYESQD